MAYYTCLCSSAPGHTGRQSDNLLAKFYATLSLEDGNFSGDDDSFPMVPLGGSSYRTPTGVSSGPSFHNPSMICFCL
jgi:hypothetical protein